MKQESEILVSYYGDDFTGSTDVMESLSLMGIPTILFLNPPSLNEIQNFNWRCSQKNGAKFMAFGVAGISRSLPADKIKDELDPIFQQIRKLPAKFFHYKICSTMDSSPKVGNIGTAMELAEKYFPSSFIPMVMGLPALNRFVIFGNLFARIGDETFRLDRHPIMSKHPVTPMHESDIRKHLEHQMDRHMALVDFFGLEKLSDTSPSEVIGNKEGSLEAPLIVFDTLEERNLVNIGNWIAKNSQSQHQLLLGSSAVEYALGNVYGASNKSSMEAEEITPTLIVAGSCSQTTAAQLTHIAELGYEMVRLDLEALFYAENIALQINKVVEMALQHLVAGKNTAIYSAMGPKDLLDGSEKRLIDNDAAPHRIALTQAGITKKIIEKFNLKRLVTAGGDTSGYILKALGITALEFKNIIAIGAPLCVAHSDDPRVDGLEIAVKGGQNGTVRYFENAQKGGLT